MSKMKEDYSTGKEIKLIEHNGAKYVKLDDLIDWLKNNQENAPEIETHWLIKIFIRLKHSK